MNKYDTSLFLTNTIPPASFRQGAAD